MTGLTGILKKKINNEQFLQLTQKKDPTPHNAHRTAPKRTISFFSTACPILHDAIVAKKGLAIELRTRCAGRTTVSIPKIKTRGRGLGSALNYLSNSNESLRHKKSKMILRPAKSEIRSRTTPSSAKSGPQNPHRHKMPTHGPGPKSQMI